MKTLISTFKKVAGPGILGWVIGAAYAKIYLEIPFSREWIVFELILLVTWLSTATGVAYILQKLFPHKEI